jgi:tetratricopeptide (TPR) repeat protein
MRKLRIFAASPVDVTVERAKVETIALELKPLADNLDIVLDVVDWHEVVPDMGRPEQIILNQLKPTAWDVFIGILWHRFGTSPGGKDPRTQREYLAGTEEEFKVAYRLWQQFGKPRIIIYRCRRAIPPDALDPDQFKRVEEFFAQFDAVQGEHPGLYLSFDTTEVFETLLRNNLQKLLLEYGEQINGEPVADEVLQAVAPKIPDNLPRRAPFFGRDKEMGIALRALSPEDRTWGVLVDGIGGIGKTALAVEAAYHCQDQGLFDAFIFISAKQNILAPGGIREATPAARTLDEFFDETARVLGQTGISQLAGNDKRRALLDALRSERALLIYDNLETLTKEAQEALVDFLRELPPSCKAIITSRRRGGEGGVWLRLEKLDWKAARAIIQSEMARDPQLAKKLRRVGEARWSELYDETRGSPLALMHTLGLMRLRVALAFDGALEMLRGNRTPDLERFIFHEARQELTVNDQAALRALSFFAPSATFDAWMDVAEMSRNALETTIDRLSALSLVDLLADEERYALHPLTRNFVHDELLADAQIAREMGFRFGKYWVAYAVRYGDTSSGSGYKTYDRLQTEWANLDAAATWLWQTAAVQANRVGDESAAVMLNDLAQAFYQFLWYVGRWDEQVRLCTRVYEAMRALNNWRMAGLRAYDTAWIYHNRDDTHAAACWADRCSEAWARGGSKFEQAIGMRMRGLVARHRKEYGAAERLLQDALGILRDLHQDMDIQTVLHDLGALERGRKQYDSAERYYREALELARKIDNREGVASCSGSLGRLALDRQYWAEACEWFEQELQLAQDIGRQELIADAQDGLARVHEAEGHPDAALPLAQAALVIRERLRHAHLTRTRELVERLRKALGGQ